jgi:uncharacterized protein YndB with AHSA1/START domain
VFAALIDAGAVAVWLPPDGMTGRFEHFDARPGGSCGGSARHDTPG